VELVLKFMYSVQKQLVIVVNLRKILLLNSYFLFIFHKSY
jgi:hypothetical protein